MEHRGGGTYDMYFSESLGGDQEALASLKSCHVVHLHMKWSMNELNPKSLLATSETSSLFPSISAVERLSADPPPRRVQLSGAAPWLAERAVRQRFILVGVGWLRCAAAPSWAGLVVRDGSAFQKPPRGDTAFTSPEFCVCFPRTASLPPSLRGPGSLRPVRDELVVRNTAAPVHLKQVDPSPVFNPHQTCADFLASHLTGSRVDTVSLEDFKTTGKLVFSRWVVYMLW